MNAAPTEAIKEYKTSEKHLDELLDAYEKGMEVYRVKVKEAELLKKFKKHMGESSASTIEETLLETGNDGDETTSSAQQNQTSQEDNKNIGDSPPLQA